MLLQRASNRVTGGVDAGMRAGRPMPTRDDVLAYFDSLSNWGRWGDDDELGTLNLISAAKRIAATQLVRVGRTVSCAWEIGGKPVADMPFGPPSRFMVATGQGLKDEHRVTVPWRAG